MMLLMRFGRSMGGTFDSFEDSGGLYREVDDAATAWHLLVVSHFRMK
jgi:hypothetical protein